MSVKLPEKRRPVSRELGGQSILLYGPPGVGKTTFASQFPDVLFLGTEDGQRHVEAYVKDVRNWKTFTETIELLKEEKTDRYKTIAIDTVDLLWTYCAEYIGKKHGFDHPSDEDWGKGYQLIRDEFQRQVNRLCGLGYGVIMISHSQDREVKTRVLTLTKTMPTLSGSARRVILPMVSIIIYAGFKYIKDKTTGEKTEQRVAIMAPSENLEAKDRTGRLPEIMKLSAKKFIQAYKGESESK